MIKQIGTRVVPLTPELALDFATMPTWRGERPLSESRVAYLRGELEAGNFHAPKWAVAKLGSQTYRMNGQHSSYMLAHAKERFPGDMNVVIDDFVVDHESELGELFTRFDTPVSVRPPREQLAALLAVSDLMKEGRSRAGLERLASAMLLAKHRFDGTPASAHLRAAVLQGDPGFIDFAWPYLGSRVLGRPAILAAMYVTWEKAGEAAASFWQMVHEETHPSPTHPTRVLARTFRELVGKGRLSLDEERQVYTRGIHAWNNWRRRVEITRLNGRARGQVQVPEAA